jgi:hypothetical protein
MEGNMRLLWWMAAAIVLVSTGAVRAQTEAERLVDRAILAHGGAANLKRLPARQSKTRGRLIRETPIPFTQEIVAHPPLRIKEITQFQAGDAPAMIVTILDHGTGRMEINGQRRALNESMVNELKESAYVAQLARLVDLNYKDYQLTPLGESSVNGRLVRGLRVTSRGHRDVTLYFDQEFGLLAKVERTVLDVVTQREVFEESVYSDWRSVDGLVTPLRVTVLRDGYKYSEVEVTEIHFLEKVSGAW